MRPIRSDSRARLLQAIALGRSWLQELTNGKVKDTDAIAAREDRSKRSVHMMLSLAFVAPDIVEAAISGRLPRGIGISRLIDLAPNWSQQRALLGSHREFDGRSRIQTTSLPKSNQSPRCRARDPRKKSKTCRDILLDLPGLIESCDVRDRCAHDACANIAPTVRLSAKLRKPAPDRGVFGGPGRIRTCDQAVMSGRL